MNGNSREISNREDPFFPEATDLRAAMKNTANGPRFSPADLQNDPKAAHDALLSWDEQSEQILRLLALHPEHGGRLETLQRADGWLRQRAAETIALRTQDGATEPGPDSTRCPPADELYDFAAGPGAVPLPVQRRLAIDRHLATCAQCDRFVGTLAVAPPSPLLLGLEEDAPVAIPALTGRGSAVADAAGRRPLRRFPRLLVLVPLAAAAALVLAFGIWRAFVPATGSAAWPEAPLMRGEAASALQWPRGRVLERSAEALRVAPWLASGLADAHAASALQAGILFELDGPAVDAEYRIQVFRTAGGAFDANAVVTTWSPLTPISVAPTTLGSGHYTWKAWTRARGLDIELGSRDFEVVSDDALLREIAGLLDRGDGVRGVGILEARGFPADARALARSLPASPERDAYLARKPSR